MISKAEIIKASAGSGKTYVLVQRYINLLLCGESPRSILASTFTVKAAGEIQDRVLRKLAEAVLNPQALEELSKECGKRIAVSEIERIFTATLRDLPYSAICTLDALVAKVAGALSVECELPIGWKLSQIPGLTRDLESQLVALQSQELGKLLPLITRSDASRKIAGPLIDTCLRFHEQLQLYGQNAFNVGEPLSQDDRIEELIEQLKSITIPKTKSGSPRVGFESAVTALRLKLAAHDPKELFQSTIIQRAIERSSFYSCDLSSHDFDSLRSVGEWLRAYEWNKIVERSKVLLPVLANFDKLYREHQHQTGNVNHADLLLAVARFMGRDSLSAVAYSLDQKFSHVLLDEFQDTSPLQWKILQPLVNDIVGDAARSRSAFIVGDPKQAIYRWRGGSSAIFAEITETLSTQSDWNQRTLETSYRSSQVILNFVNRVFENLNPVKEDFVDAAEQFKTDFKSHKASKSIPGRVTITIGEDDHLEWVLNKLKEILASNPKAKIGVLTRRNETVVEIIRELRNAEITAVGDGRAGSERTLPVEAVKALLHAKLHPADSVARHLVHISGLLSNNETIEELEKIATSPQLVHKLVILAGSGTLTKEQLKDLQLAISALSDGIERGASARELISLLQTQALPGGPGQVSVMTMHRAKGLEFDYVLLPELDTKLIRSVPPDSITWRESDGTYRIVPYINEALQNIDPRFSAADKEMRKEEVIEAFCLLYVGVTRAISELHIYGPLRESEKESVDKSPYPFSMIGIIAASLRLDLTTPGVILDTSE